MRMVDLDREDEAAVRQAAQILYDGFRDHWPHAWPDLAAALAEVEEALDPERICRAAIDEAGNVLGWVGAIPGYDGHAWELHPLVVARAEQGKGIGGALVRDLEAQVRAQGATTLFLGTDDEDSMTSLADTDLYPNVFEHIARIRNLRRHPYSFYEKQGFAIVGVIPDANGPGKPDIFMAKRVG